MALERHIFRGADRAFGHPERLGRGGRAPSSGYMLDQSRCRRARPAAPDARARSRRCSSAPLSSSWAMSRSPTDASPRRRLTRRGRLMHELALGPPEIGAAIACFRAGKSPAYDAEFRRRAAARGLRPALRPVARLHGAAIARSAGRQRHLAAGAQHSVARRRAARACPGSSSRAWRRRARAPPAATDRRPGRASAESLGGVLCGARGRR